MNYKASLNSLKPVMPSQIPKVRTDKEIQNSEYLTDDEIWNENINT